MLLAPADITNDMRFPVGSKGLTVMFCFPRLCSSRSRGSSSLTSFARAILWAPTRTHT